MSQQQISAVEQRFRKIIHQLTESEFNNPELLINKAKSFKESDAALAFRFLQRVRNIAPDNSELQKLWPSYSKAAQQANPAAMKASSRPSLVRQLSLKQIVKRGPAKALQRLKALPSSYRSPFFVVVLLPLLVFSLYQVILN